MLACLLALPLSSLQAKTLELYRGVPVPGDTAYWQVEDTYLDPQRANLNFGGQGKLAAGNGGTILIKFGDLNRVLGPTRRVKKASLVFTFYSGKQAAVKSVSQVLMPWGEGPLHVFSQNLAKPGESEKAAPWSATYNSRHFGTDGADWQSAGAQGTRDVKPIAEAKAVNEEGRVVISGLENTVQAMTDRWNENHGFALTFETPVEFQSSQSAEGRPTLVVEYEDVPAPTGADLSVTYIERVPEYERYGENSKADAKRWPADGEMVTYIAHVKNVGTAPSARFFAKWVIAERAGATVDMPAVQPGGEITLRFEKPYKNLHTDHRIQPIGVRIQPQGPDAVALNDALEIQEGALSFGITVEKSFYDAFAKEANMTGSRAFEDWLQEQFRIWNDTYMAHSRYSFAPSGSLERCRIQSITVVPDGSAAASSPSVDGMYVFKAGDRVKNWGADANLLRRLSADLGLASLSAMSVQASAIELPGLPGRSRPDPFGGLIGAGDTRNESALPLRLSLPYEPVSDPLMDRIDAEVSDLYSATAVGAMNSNLGKRRGISGDYLYDLPALSLLRLLDLNGRPLPFVDLAFYQTQNGKILSGEPAFTVKGDGSGSAVLPNRPAGETQPIVTPTGHTLKANPFGKIDLTGGNGVFLVKATYKGQTEWGWLKLWQLVDAAYRGNKGVAVVDLRFNLPVDVLDPENIAKGRTVTDSAGTTLAGLTDDSLTTGVAVPGAADAWIEIDLGRDRTIGEVRLFLADGAAFWNQFDVKVYATGEQPNKATAWSEERLWSWSSVAHRDAVSGGSSVAYHGLPQRIRYIRISNRGGAVPGTKLSEIRVMAVKAS